MPRKRAPASANVAWLRTVIDDLQQLVAECPFRPIEDCRRPVPGCICRVLRAYGLILGGDAWEDPPRR